MLILPDTTAQAWVGAIHAGDLTTLRRLLADDPSLAQARVETTCGNGVGARSALHLVADWPGHRPNGAAMVRLLVEAGADVNARFVGTHTETPLHWAASCDDVDVLDALLDAGADLEADGAVIGGGTPLADAVAFGQWRAARRLVERGATATLWQAAALGLLDRVEVALAAGPSRDEVTNALWCAAHGGQSEAADRLIRAGGDTTWVGHDHLTPADAAARSGHPDLAARLRVAP